MFKMCVIALALDFANASVLPPLLIVQLSTGQCRDLKGHLLASVQSGRRHVTYVHEHGTSHTFTFPRIVYIRTSVCHRCWNEPALACRGLIDKMQGLAVHTQALPRLSTRSPTIRGGRRSGRSDMNACQELPAKIMWH